MVKHREIGKRNVFTKNIMKKAQNDIDFIPLIMNHTISDAQKYSSLSSAAIKSSCWTRWGGGGRSAMKVSLRWSIILHKSLFFPNDRWMGEQDSCLVYLSPVGIGIKAVVTNHHLSLIGNMRGDSGNKLQIIHLLKPWAVFAILIANLTFSLINREPLEG